MVKIKEDLENTERELIQLVTGFDLSPKEKQLLIDVIQLRFKLERLILFDAPAKTFKERATRRLYQQIHVGRNGKE